MGFVGVVLTADDADDAIVRQGNWAHSGQTLAPRGQQRHLMFKFDWPGGFLIPAPVVARDVAAGKTGQFNFTFSDGPRRRHRVGGIHRHARRELHKWRFLLQFQIQLLAVRGHHAGEPDTEQVAAEYFTLHSSGKTDRRGQLYPPSSRLPRVMLNRTGSKSGDRPKFSNSRQSAVWNRNG